jgi:circadian clock protein KaiC
MTNLAHPGGEEQTKAGISSLMDTWILLQLLEANGERNRGLYVLKSRGMAHSNQIREFILSRNGVTLIEPYTGMGDVKTGSARYIQETIDMAEAKKREDELGHWQRKLETRRKVIDAQIAALQAEFETEKSEFDQVLNQERQLKHIRQQEKKHLGSLRENLK